MRTFRIVVTVAAAAVLSYGSLSATPSESQASRLLASVVDQQGAPVTGLDKSDFIVRVNGKDATVLDVQPLDEPLSIVVVPEGFSSNLISDARNTLRAIVNVARKHHPDTKVGLMLGEGASTPTMYRVSDQASELDREISRYFYSPTSSPIMDSILVATQTLSAERNRARVVLVVSVGGVFQDSLPATRIAKAVYESGSSFWAMDAVRSRPIGASAARVLAEITTASGGRHESSSLAALTANTEKMMTDIVSRYAVSFEAPGYKDAAVVAVRRPGLSVAAPSWPSKISGQ
jgi:hypothetical protein